VNWSERTLPVDGTTEDAFNLLFADQLVRWSLLSAGHGGLREAQRRVVSVQGFDLVAWHIPHRITSSTARTDDHSIRDRPCFLCAPNLPREERAISLGGDFVVTCNPFPILEKHVSVVCREHRPQRIWSGESCELGIMLDLSRDLPDFLILYNGPECGASAPDHMHFQACRRRGVPILSYLDRAEKGLIPGFPSNPIVLRGRDRDETEAQFVRLMARLRSVVAGRQEPMVNVIVLFDGSGWAVLVFPRLRHRPAVYDRGEFTWSPGALDLAGVLVLPVQNDLKRATSEVFERGFIEVCLGYDDVRRLAEGLELS